MARNGKPPMPREGAVCRACAGPARQFAMGDGLFCSDHELLWIAKSGVVSHRLHRKYGKMYRQFLRQQNRDWHMERNRGLLKDMLNQNDSAFRQWARDINTGFQNRGFQNVYPATLRGFGQGLQGREEEADSDAGPKDGA